jgi:hypothetical protein
MFRISGNRLDWSKGKRYLLPSIDTVSETKRKRKGLDEGPKCDDGDVLEIVVALDYVDKSMDRGFAGERCLRKSAGARG